MNKIDDMRYKAILLLVSILALATSVKAQETYTVNDTIYNPKVVFSGHHPKYEIAGIKVTGADNYEDYIIIGYSGLSIGQRVEIPGEDIKNAAKRFWRQGLARIRPSAATPYLASELLGHEGWREEGRD